jgi:hypothetical protein
MRRKTTMRPGLGAPEKKETFFPVQRGKQAALNPLLGLPALYLQVGRLFVDARFSASSSSRTSAAQTGLSTTGIAYSTFPM